MVRIWNYIVVHGSGAVELSHELERLLDAVTHLTNLDERLRGAIGHQRRAR